MALTIISSEFLEIPISFKNAYKGAFLCNLGMIQFPLPKEILNECFIKALPNPNDPSFGYSNAPGENFFIIDKNVRLNTLRFFLDQGADPNYKKGYAINVAIWTRWEALFDLLLTYNVTISQENVIELCLKRQHPLFEKVLQYYIFPKDEKIKKFHLDIFACFCIYKNDISAIRTLKRHGLQLGRLDVMRVWFMSVFSKWEHRKNATDIPDNDILHGINKYYPEIYRILAEEF